MKIEDTIGTIIIICQTFNDLSRKILVIFQITAVQQQWKSSFYLTKKSRKMFVFRLESSLWQASVKLFEIWNKKWHKIRQCKKTWIATRSVWKDSFSKCLMCKERYQVLNSSFLKFYFKNLHFFNMWARIIWNDKQFSILTLNCRLEKVQTYCTGGHLK